MRRILFALGLSLGLAQSLAAFEVESTQDFGPEAPPRVLSVLSTTDTAILAPVITAYLAQTPGLGLRYVMASSQEVHRAIADEGAAFDLVISSAMDLQMKLANDGFALSLPADLVADQPVWSRWRDLLVSVAQEPVVLILADGVLRAGEDVPRTRRDLIALLRDNPDRFRGRVGTYDPAVSGAGYLFAAQDARLSDTFWRLAEVMGRLDARLFCCSVDMIDEVRAGRLLVGYNVLGLYTQAQGAEGITVVELEDFTLTLLRTALIPRTAPEPEAATDFMRFLLSAEGQALIASGDGLAAVEEAAFERNPHLRPIRLDPGLLANLDAVSRNRFLTEWRAAMEQP
ncbi:MAG: ABC transporter substrate-binding protein [Pseudotabrizicola sp.]|uniref:ABC transporter substrate-binding protein n=1 Tax=Pseudotabrizicola sp. TaxID=2939647 RepID=UPI00272FD919|nr:ABC transporter substrate-binding protein [Pseudotabrizicola sp.]MDP2079738.1 ABC transporter substrate-binding protein [Pseudotabrizicola sp.]MDZ7574739.1 ABC transporter substrate-binding protein [Pseudotabrizicola sp.]